MYFMETRPLIPSWSSTPIPNFTLSAGGLLALADLQTVARRTALTGGSSWLDALVLAPGLHYQQACDSLDHEDVPGWIGQLAAIQIFGGGEVRHAINNVVTLNYLRQLVRDGAPGVTVDVAESRNCTINILSKAFQTRQMSSIDIDWLSQLLYIGSPILTIGAIVFMILFEDWWGLSFILALMLARILNIWVIKHRSSSPPSNSPLEDRLTEYTINLGSVQVRFRGLDTDLQAITTQAWLRAKSHLDGCLEACAKLIVSLVAVLSGNLSQAGGIVLVALLLISAALLGLSNAHSRGFRMHGRYVIPQVSIKTKRGGSFERSPGLSLQV